MYFLLKIIFFAFSLGVMAQELPAISDDAYVIRHTGFTLSYNLKTYCPDWVAWKLTKEHLKGNVSRKNNDFQGDPVVDVSNRVTPYEYKKSGYDRGHMCPAGDNKWSSRAMMECFYMTNMCPQVAVLNQRWWSNLENACRRWVQKEDTLYICCGPIYQGETFKTIGGRYNYSQKRKGIKVFVPTGFYKVVLSLKKGKEKAIGFIYNNDDSRQPMSECCTSVDDVEKITGLDFFSSLEDTLEECLESQYDFSAWK